MKKLVVRAVIFAVFSAGLTSAVGIATAGTASACTGSTAQSARLAASMPQVRYGDRGTDVLALQLALRNEGYALEGTGNYAHLTLGVVKDFQRKHGINASGVVGSRTWQALVGKIPAGRSGVDWVRTPAFGVQPGERHVEKVGLLYNAIERIHPYAAQGMPEETDVYGAALQKRVKDFQRRAGIKASGVVGPKTWAAMYKVISTSGRWGC